ncbi:MAG: hypothetical protein QMD85_03345 [Candidatus Aenigmarchaeota archaeon]|nr:hypothetical protein [Candidatus Aenigmarchaeota archaeon]
MKRYYLALVILIPVYIIIGFFALRSDFFDSLNIILAVVWLISLFAFYKSRNHAPKRKK